MWYSGSAVMIDGASPPSARDSQPSTWAMLARMFRCRSIAPLDTPVVPPVYCRKAMSSWPTAKGFMVFPAPSASTSLKRTAPGRL